MFIGILNGGSQSTSLSVPRWTLTLQVRIHDYEKTIPERSPGCPCKRSLFSTFAGYGVSGLFVVTPFNTSKQSFPSGERKRPLKSLTGPVDSIIIPGSLKTDSITVEVRSTDDHIDIRIGNLDNAVRSPPVKNLFTIKDCTN